MAKKISFSFESGEYEGVGATEIFTFEALGIDEHMDEKALKIEINRIFQAWVSHKLNISYSIVWEGSDTVF